MAYAVEWFGERIEMPDAPLALGMRDSTWHNDASPSFTLGGDAEWLDYRITLWINSEEGRELCDGAAYLVESSNEMGDYTFHYQGDSLEDALREVGRLKDAYLASKR